MRCRFVGRAREEDMGLCQEFNLNKKASKSDRWRDLVTGKAQSLKLEARDGRINGPTCQDDKNGGEKLEAQGAQAICENPRTITRLDTRLVCFQWTDSTWHL